MIIVYEFKSSEKLKIKIRDREDYHSVTLSSENNQNLCFDPFFYVNGKDIIHVEIFQPKLKSRYV